MIHQLAAVDRRAKIGKDVTIEPFTTIAGDVEIGDGTWIGPNVTIMDGARIGKNCRVFPGTVISAIPQDLKFDGEDTKTIIGDRTTIRETRRNRRFHSNGGLSAVHQFGKIGKHVMISGGTLVRKDIPPYVKVAREPMSYAGINSVGLRRRGFSNERIFEIQKVYRAVFQMKLNVSQAITFIEKELPPTEDRDEIVEFIKNSPRGIVKGYGSGKE
ncbi:hypothetical protein Lal_00042794 [Lupinus albus]|nr:hypothetical protein Lal_00042794 [Lupinus albus]